MINNTLTVSQVAIKLGIKETTLYKICSRGEIPHFKVGQAIRFNIDTLEQWIKEQELNNNNNNIKEAKKK